MKAYCRAIVYVNSKFVKFSFCLYGVFSKTSYRGSHDNP